MHYFLNNIILKCRLFLLFKTFKLFESQGKELLDLLTAEFACVSDTTAPKGLPLLEKEMLDCNAAFEKHVCNLGTLIFENLF